MLYLFDTYYTNKIDFIKSVEVTSRYISKKCKFIEAEIISPKTGYKGTLIKKGKLPIRGKEKYIKNVINWLTNNSATIDLFKLIIYSGKTAINEPKEFDHHDDTCCWVLNLESKDFEKLGIELSKNDLPSDLFYESSRGVSVKSKGILGFFGFTKYYTPKELEELNTKL